MAAAIGFAIGALPPVLISGSLFLGSSLWAPRGSELTVLPLIVSIPVGLCASGVFIFKRTLLSGLVAVFAFSVFISSILGTRIGGDLRMSAFKKVAGRARPVIVAIEEYKKKYSKYPETLEALSPEILPSDLLGTLPPLVLVTGEEALKGYYGNPWALQADVGIGVLNWDLFLYLPKQNYPQEAFGGYLERVDDWAYVHE